MIDPAIAHLIILDIAALLTWSALQKFSAQREFLDVVRAYRVLPETASRAAARLIPAVELAVAAAILAPPSRRAAGLTAAALLLLYGGAMAVNLARGRRDLDCGCSLASGRRLIAAWMPVRNAMIACAAGAVSLPWIQRPLGVLDWVTVVAGASASALLYASVDALLGRVVPAAAMARAR